MEIKVKDFTIPLTVNCKDTANKAVMGQESHGTEISARVQGTVTQRKSNSVQADPATWSLNLVEEQLKQEV